jgi:N-acetyl-gamma-glutamylphosphate reductase
LLAAEPRVAAFCAAPHGESAALVDGVVRAAQEAGSELSLVDVSADFRFPSAQAWERVYGRPHGAPQRIPDFVCGVPELLAGATAEKVAAVTAHAARGDGAGVPRGAAANEPSRSALRLVAHPGCFTTAALLATVPLVRLGLIESEVVVVAVTGSTGAGRTLTQTTHHPERRSDLFAYSPLAHRHQPEMEALAAAAGAQARIRFVPQAGPFARGIHATLVGKPIAGVDATAARRALAEFYAGSPFVSVGEAPPHLTEVVGSNRARLAVAADGGALVAFVVLDNLVKGAAGGAVQWMNRLLGLPESTGLLAAGPGWL